MSKTIEINMKDVPRDVKHSEKKDRPCGGMVMDYSDLATATPPEDRLLRPFDLVIRCPDPYLAMDIAELVQEFIGYDYDGE